MDSSSEIGRELKASELKPGSIVVLAKEGRTAMATVWVVQVGDVWVHFEAPAIRMRFVAVRSGPDLEQLTDDVRSRLRVFEYLGEP
jgi:hypothetical protein